MRGRPRPREQGADLRFHDLRTSRSSFLADALRGLARSPKRIPPKYFYDARGSALFEAICALPEYYPTRTEMAIMRAHIDDIARCVGGRAQLIELGSGASTKTRLLIETARPSRYVPVDISEAALRAACARLHADYPGLPIHAVCADFSRLLRLRPPIVRADAPRVVYFPGSTIGNFSPEEALRFLRRLAAWLGGGGKLLIGVDTKKDPAVLEAAYNDAQGVTAAFNLNLLARMNRELGADFELSRFRHRAFYDPRGWVEMHLESLAAQQVRVGARMFTFAAGETVHTEISCKYAVSEFQGMARAAGLEPLAVWTDADGWFSVHLLSVRGPR